MAATWAFTSLLGPIVVGTGATQRIGNKIFVKRIEFSLLMVPQTTQPATGCVSRFVVYHNKETRGSLPAALDLFTAATVDALRSTPKKPALTLMKDFTTTGVVMGSAGAGPPLLQRFAVRVNKRIDYTGTGGGTATDLLKDDYGFGMICSAPTACNMTFNAKIVFADA